MTMLDAQGRIKPLVERLRQARQEGREIIEPWDHDPFLFDEAADEIERLRAALTKIIALDRRVSGVTSEDHMEYDGPLGEIARRALEQTGSKTDG